MYEQDLDFSCLLFAATCAGSLHFSAIDKHIPSSAAPFLAGATDWRRCGPGVVTTVRFKMPGNGQQEFPTAGPPKTIPTYYSFNYGPVHFM